MKETTEKFHKRELFNFYKHCCLSNRRNTVQLLKIIRSCSNTENVHHIIREKSQYKLVIYYWYICAIYLDEKQKKMFTVYFAGAL